MEADLTVGDSHRQEYYPGEAEDLAEVVRDGVRRKGWGFDDLIVIEEWTPLEPDVVEEKYYASGVGVVLETTVQGQRPNRADLVHLRQLGLTRNPGRGDTSPGYRHASCGQIVMSDGLSWRGSSPAAG